jgi:hypothetical protein
VSKGEEMNIMLDDYPFMGSCMLYHPLLSLSGLTWTEPQVYFVTWIQKNLNELQIPEHMLLKIYYTGNETITCSWNYQKTSCIVILFVS